MKTFSKVLTLTAVTSALACAAPSFAQTQESTPFETPQTSRAFNFLSAGVADHDGGGDSIIVEGSYQFNSPWFISGYLRDGDDGPFGDGRDRKSVV